MVSLQFSVIRSYHAVRLLNCAQLVYMEYLIANYYQFIMSLNRNNDRNTT